ncbi:hypothetical protein [Altererythrobacter fulvus]|uniref:hypothetical protein n=1 Tax=Caenibius fulvus TaxID=2126012 RepID=UPI0030195417
MAKSRALDWMIRGLCGVIAIFNVTQLTGLEISPPIKGVGQALTSLFLIGFLVLAIARQAQIGPFRGIEK